MSSDINHIVTTGRLTADAIAKEFGENTVFDFSIAVNHYDKKEKKDVADFFSVKLWAGSEKQAGFYKSILTKGAAVVVEGRLSQERWEKDGQKMSKVTILANSVASMGGKKGGDSSESFPSEDDGFPER